MICHDGNVLAGWIWGFTIEVEWGHAAFKPWARHHMTWQHCIHFWRDTTCKYVHKNIVWDNNKYRPARSDLNILLHIQWTRLYLCFVSCIITEVEETLKVQGITAAAVGDGGKVIIDHECVLEWGGSTDCHHMPLVVIEGHLVVVTYTHRTIAQVEGQMDMSVDQLQSEKVMPWGNWKDRNNYTYITVLIQN